MGKNLAGVGDDVIKALEVLDVDRSVDIDRGFQNLFHVLPALLVPRSGSIAVSQFGRDLFRPASLSIASGEGRMSSELVVMG